MAYNCGLNEVLNGTLKVLGLLTANAGLTVPTGQAVTLTGTTTLTIGTGLLNTGGAITAAGLITANNGITIPTGKVITITDAPSAATDGANKAYVDGVAQGLSIKAQCEYATIAPLSPTNTYSNGTLGVGATLTATGVGVLTVDGVATVLGDRILVKNEASTLKNGIYKVTTEGTAGVAYVLTRATDCDTSAKIDEGAFTFIEAGGTLASTGWVQTAADPVIGTDPITFAQFSGAGTYTAGSGLTLTGTVFSFGNGTAAAPYTLGDLHYALNSTTLAKLSGNITTTLQVLSQTGTGAVSAAPVWTSAVSTATASTVVLRDGSAGAAFGGTLTTAAITASGLISATLGLTVTGAALTVTGQNTSLAQFTASGIATLQSGQVVKTRAASSLTITVATTDYVVISTLGGAGVSMSLPAAAAGLFFVLKGGVGDEATNNITITPAAGTIDGQASFVIDSPYGSVSITSDGGADWHVV